MVLPWRTIVVLFGTTSRDFFYRPSIFNSEFTFSLPGAFAGLGFGSQPSRNSTPSFPFYVSFIFLEEAFAERRERNSLVFVTCHELAPDIDDFILWLAEVVPR